MSEFTIPKNCRDWWLAPTIRTISEKKIIVNISYRCLFNILKLFRILRSARIEQPTLLPVSVTVLGRCRNRTQGLLHSGIVYILSSFH